MRKQWIPGSLFPRAHREPGYEARTRAMLSGYTQSLELMLVLQFGTNTGITGVGDQQYLKRSD